MSRWNNLDDEVDDTTQDDSQDDDSGNTDAQDSTAQESSNNATDAIVPPDDSQSDEAPSNPETGAGESPAQDDSSGVMPVNPILKAYLQRQQDLQSALEQTKQNQLKTGLIAAFANLVHAGARQPNDLSALQSVAQADDAPLKNLLQKQAQAKDAMQIQQQIADNDPNSPAAQAMKKVMLPIFQKLGIDPAALSAMGVAQMKQDVQPMVENQFKAQSILDARREAIQARQDAAAQAQGDKLDKQQQLVYNQVTKALDSVRGDKESMNAEADRENIAKAKGLLDDYRGRWDEMPPQQVQLLADELGKIGAGGVANEGMVKSIAPGTLALDAASLKNRLLNGTDGASASPWLAKADDYLKSVDKATTAALNARVNRILTAQREQLGEHGYNLLNQTYTRKALYDSADKPAHPQDAQAVAWAKANPDDPRAKKILQINGGG